ncbi:MAG: YfcC family protein [Ruminococcus sp.]|nr:YfcC family protein [Ruminococcus sp.]
MEKKKEKTLIDISLKTFIQVTVLLVVLLAAAVVLTYVIPAGQFGTLPDGKTDYTVYERLGDDQGISIWKGILAPILVFGSEDGLTLIMLSVFLLVISAAFQVMNDTGGINALVGTVSERFRNRRYLLIAVLSLLFMSFGAFLGLFEEMLTMLPIVAILCVMNGFDSFTGFLVCIVSCGFGFASAITNPFTVLLASEIIGVNPMEKIWYRIIIFVVMYLLLLGFIFLYLRRIKKDPTGSCTYEHDRRLREAAGEHSAESSAAGRGRILTVYSTFLLMSLVLITVCSAIPALRSYTVVVLAAYFLIFGLAAGVLCGTKFKAVLGSFFRGITGALPTIVFIGLAASVKYVFDEGRILPTIANEINELAAGKNIFLIALIVYGIVLFLEFFISSSTAKAILVMGLLSVVDLGLSDRMSVLIYTFGDGYTNLLFPTSPVLLISLSMIETDYFKWLKKSWPLFLVNLVLVIGFLGAGLAIGY